jgi:hypothetical protein
MRPAPSFRDVSMTCASSGRPPSGCRTFGNSERIRLPTPAARIAMLRDFGAEVAMGSGILRESIGAP